MIKKETYRGFIYRIRSQNRKANSGRGCNLSIDDYKALQELIDRINELKPIYPLKFIKN